MSQSDLTLIIALYGAILSTIIAIRGYVKDRRHVKVTCNIAFAPSPLGETWEFVSIKVVNIGHRPIEITSAGILQRDKSWFTQLRSNTGIIPLPAKLEDGESVTVMFDLSKIEEALRNSDRSDIKYARAFVKDAEDNTYTARLPRLLKDRNLAK